MKVAWSQWWVFCSLISSCLQYVSCSYNYDFTGRDFRNSQKEMLCLIARLNVSFEITYRGIKEELFLPSEAHKNNSQCDFNFLSVLRLDFPEAEFQLSFQRDVVEVLSTQRSYCDQCDNGNWKLGDIELLIKNASLINDKFPSTRLVARVSGDNLIGETGGLTSGISVFRGYNCTDQVLSASLVVRKAIDLSSLSNSTDNWDLKVKFYTIAVQPFLVTNNVITDPVLCKDVSIFIALIIAIPLIYFFFFILIYRMKERYGCPPDWKRKLLVNECNDKSAAKHDINESPPDCKLMQSTTTSEHISITCTSPDQTQKPIM